MAGGRSVPVGSSRSSSNSRGGLYTTTKCNCGLDAVVRTMKKGHNIGSRFYECPKWQDTNCNFMKWVDCTNGDDLRLQIFDGDTTIAELEMHNKFLEDKLKIMQGQREKMEVMQQLKEELCDMRTELMQCSRNETN
uniref:GRF-type domain-containing protein n=1 Tax=Chenopodium quinoa TaxID=63459 RepID=A0A803LZ44_CHEQI